MAHSALQLRVLLHHHYSGTSWSPAEGVSPAAKEAFDYWLRNGCLEVETEDPDCDFRLTDRGKAMVELWLRQELPTLAWLDENGERIEFS